MAEPDRADRRLVRLLDDVARRHGRQYRAERRAVEAAAGGIIGSGGDKNSFASLAETYADDGYVALTWTGRLVTSRIGLDEAPRALVAMTGASPVGITVIRP